ncbi:hypothetical protein J31TS4_15800 [Paenibacillus sp. J31TS4]|uniref:hypothetical protein n=1 Tax=Paenibacillus sp. J31TS4 TaxID=2807195 RepID=UPI001AFD95EA|nr:hypothetical protein [Paenibacillus sp. J31TS4]GIP38300.1 hypothetical protein J31TS4_15800 [Paenibacillus sp. J31TS4]
MQWSETTPLSPANLNDLEARITQAAANVESGKSAIVNAIVAMNQAATTADTFATLSNKIKAISSDANAAVGQVLSGVTFYAGGAKRTGTLSNRGGQTVSDNAANTVAITSVSGFGLWGDGYGGSLYFKPGITAYIDQNTILRQEVYGLNPEVVKAGQTIGANSTLGAPGQYVRGTYTSDGNAVAADAVSGKVFYANGVRYVGTQPERGAYGPPVNYVGTPGTLWVRIPLGMYRTPTATGYPEIQINDPNFLQPYILNGWTMLGMTGTGIPHAYNSDAGSDTFFGNSTTYRIARSFTIDAHGTNAYNISWTMFASYGIADVRVNGRTLANTWFRSNPNVNYFCSLNLDLTRGDILDIVIRTEYQENGYSLWGAKITNKDAPGPRWITRNTSREGQTSV